MSLSSVHYISVKRAVKQTLAVALCMLKKKNIHLVALYNRKGITRKKNIVQVFHKLRQHPNKVTLLFVKLKLFIKVKVIHYY